MAIKRESAAVLAAAIVAATASATATRAQTTVIGPAPSGDPVKVAGKMISDAEHPCPALRSAVRLDDGSIRAVCSNGETYRLGTINGRDMALRCSVAAKLLGIKDC